MRRKLFCGGAFLVAAFALVGCDREEVLYDVTGTVTFDGKPIPKGLIFFDPDVTKGGTGPQGFANILDGKFTTAVQGKGVRGGAYVVRVNGYDGKEAPEAPFGQYLFPEYEEKRELPKENSHLDLSIAKKKKG
jgi:hypothetical protein